MFADSNVIAASQLNIHTYDKSNEIEFERSKKKITMIFTMTTLFC